MNLAKDYTERIRADTRKIIQLLLFTLSTSRVNSGRGACQIIYDVFKNKGRQSLLRTIKKQLTNTYKQKEQ